ncbi:MAG: ribonuclease P protein component [Thermotogota bacterium]
MVSQKFEKNERLRLRNDFKKLFDSKGRAVNSYFVLVFRKNDLEYSRIAVSIKKKFGKAVLRNKLRRQIKEIYRTNKQNFPQGYDFLFIPRKALSNIYKNVDYSDIKNMIFDTVRKVK